MNGNISLSSHDEDLDIVYGMYSLTDGMSELALASFKYIATDISDIKTNYIRLGFHLNECEIWKYYEDFGYLTLAEFANANFGLDKSAVSKCLNVFRRFALCVGNVYKMQLMDYYKDYSYSQLCEMVSLDSEALKQIKPAMTISQIREYKKSLKTTVTTVATSQPVKQDDNGDELEELEEIANAYSSISDDEFVRDLLECSRDFIECNFPEESFVNIGISGKRLSIETEDAVYCLQFSKSKKKGESA